MMLDRQELESWYHDIKEGRGIRDDIEETDDDEAVTDELSRKAVLELTTTTVMETSTILTTSIWNSLLSKKLAIIAARDMDTKAENWERKTNKKMKIWKKS